MISYLTLHQSNQFGLCVPYVAGTQMVLSLLDNNVRPRFFGEIFIEWCRYKITQMAGSPNILDGE